MITDTTLDARDGATVIVTGDHVRRLERRQGHALLETVDARVYLDEGAVRKAALALGLQLVRETAR